jgi:hypothetical protein
MQIFVPNLRRFWRRFLRRFLRQLYADFYGIWTYVTHTVFHASVVTVPVLAAAFLAAVPVAGQYLVNTFLLIIFWTAAKPISGTARPFRAGHFQSVQKRETKSATRMYYTPC